MNDITKKMTAFSQPRAALIAYCHPEDYNDTYHLEFRRIGEDGKMGEGQPVSYEFMATIASSFVESHGGVPYGALPGNMLYCDSRKGGEKYVWYNPPRKRVMHFKENLNIESAEYHVPGIVYVASNDHLLVYAFKGEKPLPEDQLFRAPFFNVYESGSVCLGSAKATLKTNPTFTELLNYWEKLFWNSEFANTIGGSSTKSNLVMVIKKSRKKAFDINELLLINKQLKSLLK